MLISLDFCISDLQETGIGSNKTTYTFSHPISLVPIGLAKVLDTVVPPSSLDSGCYIGSSLV